MSMAIGNKNDMVKRALMRNASKISAARAAAREAARKTTNKSKPKEARKKKLQYNFKEISNKILKTKTSGSAQRVLIQARSRVAMLRRRLGSAEYDSTELNNAIIHAEAMVRAARKKMKHLRTEENAERKKKTPEDDRREQQQEEAVETDEQYLQADEAQDIKQEISKELEQELRRIMEETIEESMRKTFEAMKETMEMYELSEEFEEAVDEMKPADLEQLKKKHRAEEQREVIEADMKYLKALFDKLEKEKRSESTGFSGNNGGSDTVSGTPAVSLEIAGKEMPVPDTPPEADSAGGNVDVAI